MSEMACFRQLTIAPFDLARAFRKRYGFTPSRFRANCLHLMFTQTLPAEKTSKAIDMMFPSGAQG